MNQLKQLETRGQSPWLDYLERGLIEEGALCTLIERDGLKGVTSNTSSFEKAVGETDEYAEALNQFQAQSYHSISAIYEIGAEQNSTVVFPMPFPELLEKAGKVPAANGASRVPLVEDVPIGCVRKELT